LVKNYETINERHFFISMFLMIACFIAFILSSIGGCLIQSGIFMFLLLVSWVYFMVSVFKCAINYEPIEKKVNCRLKRSKIKNAVIYN